MEKIKLLETFQSDYYQYNDGTSLNESGDTSIIDGVNIIGMVEGQFFQPDGMSRNKRWYPRSLWENVLSSADVKNRLANHTMFGEIGHSDGPVTDMTLRNGEASHIITDLWIDEKGRGMGRAYILNTQKGRDLKIYLGAGAKLKVSTRGEGIYLDGQYHDGCPIIDPDSYELQTVDFVLNPGFMETSANLTAQKESVSEVEKPSNITEAKVYDTKDKVTVKSTEGERFMTLDVDNYVQELKDKNAKLEAKIESLSEELKSKEKELLEAKFTESSEMKSLKEEYAPFKKMGVSAKTINETLKRSQKVLDKTKAENAKLTEALKEFQDTCGSVEQVKEATKLSEMALNKIKEYQELGSVEDIKNLISTSESIKAELEKVSEVAKQYEEIGTVEQIKELSENCAKVLPKLSNLKALKEASRKVKQYEALGTVKEIKELSKNCELALPKLKQLEELKAYKDLGTIEDIKSLSENCEKSIKRLQTLKKYEAIGSTSEIKTLAENCKKALPRLKQLEEYKALGTVDEIKELSANAEKILPKLEELKVLEDYKKLGTVEDIKTLAKQCESLIPQVKKVKEAEELKSSVKKAQQVIEQYVKTVGSIKEAKQLVESRKETLKKVNFREAVVIAKKFGTTVESTAKLMNKYGTEKATKMLEEASKKRVSKKSVDLAESTQLVEEAAQMDKVKNVKEATITAKDFVSKGMITNAFNLDAFGKKIAVPELNDIDGDKVEGLNQAHELLKKYNKDFGVEELPVKLEGEKTAADAEKELKKLLKK